MTKRMGESLSGRNKLRLVFAVMAFLLGLVGFSDGIFAQAAPPLAATADTKATSPSPSPSLYDQAHALTGKLPAADQQRLAAELLPDPARLRYMVEQLPEPDRVMLIKNLSGSASAPYLLIAVIGVLVALFGASLILWMWDLQKKMLAAGADIKDIEDLPLGVPTGTVRAVLALLVVGTALLLLVASGLGVAVPESLIGIVGMVLGFYFGTRTGSGDELKDAAGQIANTAQELGKQTQQKDQLQQAAGQLGDENKDLKGKLDSLGTENQRLQEHGATPALDVLLVQGARRVGFSNALIGCEQDAGLPVDLTAYGSAVQSLSALLASAQSGSAGDADLDQRKAIAGAIVNLPDRPNDPSSPLGAPLQGAASLFSAQPVTGTQDDRAKLVMLMSVGANLGSHAYLCWKARILWAPAGKLIDAGTLTGDDLAAAATAVPTIEDLPQGDDRNQFLRAAAGLDDVDAAQLQAIGSSRGNALFDDFNALVAPVQQFRQNLLGAAVRQAITADSCNTVSRTLSEAQSVLRVEAGQPTSQEIAQLVDAAAAHSSTVAGDDDDAPADPAIADLHTLVLVVDLARRDNIDLPALFAEFRDAA